MLNSENYVKQAWIKVMKDVEKNRFNLTDENTLIIKFILEFIKIYGIYYELNYDLKYYPYKGLLGNKNRSIDLILFKNETKKIAIEFLFVSDKKNEYPISQIRKNIYQEIARLNYLVNKDKNNIEEAYFLCTVDKEKLINPKYHLRRKYKTHDGYVYDEKKGRKYVKFLSLPQKFTFNWLNVKNNGKNNVIPCNFAWLEPIKISKRVKPTKKKTTKTETNPFL